MIVVAVPAAPPSRRLDVALPSEEQGTSTVALSVGRYRIIRILKQQGWVVARPIDTRDEARPESPSVAPGAVIEVIDEPQATYLLLAREHERGISSSPIPRDLEAPGPEEDERERVLLLAAWRSDLGVFEGVCHTEVTIQLEPRIVRLVGEAEDELTVEDERPWWKLF